MHAFRRIQQEHRVPCFREICSPQSSRQRSEESITPCPGRKTVLSHHGSFPPGIYGKRLLVFVYVYAVVFFRPKFGLAELSRLVLS